MSGVLAFLLLSFALSFALAPLVIDILYKFQLREEVREDGPKTHLKKRGTPTMGGLIFVPVIFLVNLLLNRQNQVLIVLLAAVLGGAFGAAEDLIKIYNRSRLKLMIRAKVTPIVTLSNLSWDIYRLFLLPWNTFKEIFRALGSRDRIGLKSYQKALIQILVGAAVAAAVYLSFGGGLLRVPFLGFVNLGWLFFPWAIFLVFLFVNAVNITDGLDGLAAGLALMAFVALMSLGLVQARLPLAIFCATAAGALLTFLYFNIHPARVFMGNVGSASLGAALAAVGLLLHQEIALLVIGGVFVLDGVVSVLVQVGSVKLGRGRVFRMAPLHHHFELLGWHETKVTMRFWLVGAVLAFVGVLAALL